MKTEDNVLLKMCLVAFLVIAMAGCPTDEGGGEGEGEGAAAEGEGEGQITGDLARGGQLYDKWWTVTGAAEPTTDHPLWATQTADPPNARTGSDTWRCKECHGWDYIGVLGRYSEGSHMTGFAGIENVAGATNRTKTSQDVFDEIKTNHSYGDVLSDTDIADLTEFVLNGQLDTAAILDTSGATPVFIGDAAAGAVTYDAVCAGCHGADGLMEITEGFVHGPGYLSNDNPQEFQHKVSFGHPGSVPEMPAQVALLTVAEIGELGAYAQSLPQAAPDLVRGGQLYDKWWAVTEATAPTTDHPLWATQTADPPNARTGADTWRCKECHGWDYIGKLGRYETGSHATGFDGIEGVAGAINRTKSFLDVFGELKTDHGYGDVLDDVDIWDLVEFVLNGQLDITAILDTSGTTPVFTGDAVAGAVTYDAVCAGCHGADGLTEITVGFVHGPGYLSNDNPQEFQHKVSFGHPGSDPEMPPQAELLTVEEIGDLGKHAQTLPIPAK